MLLHLSLLLTATLAQGAPSRVPATVLVIPLETQDKALHDFKSASLLTSPENGVIFDLDGDGTPERTGWTDSKSRLAFLALDRDGDGQITSGKELFGSHILPGVPNGFAALAKLAQESNRGIKRKSVSADDTLFSKLLLWEDVNHNGISEFNELQPASNLFSDILLGYMPHRRKDGRGNEFRFKGFAHVRTAPGRNQAIDVRDEEARKIIIYDVVFVRQ